MSSSAFYETPILVVKQSLGDFYIACFPARILLDVAYSHRLKATLQSDGSYELEGSQRLINDKRLEQIGNFIDSPEWAFPNTLILAANFIEESGELEETESLRWRVSVDKNGQTGKLVIPTKAKLAAIIDGQHRLFGFKFANQGKLNMPLACAIYFDLPKPYQAYLFATINSNQKPVDKSQTYELFGYNTESEPPDSWTPDKLAVFLARKLNTESDSPFYRHIVIAAENDIVQSMSDARRAGDWMISMATVVEGILRLYSRNAKEDAYAMLGDSHSSRRLRSKLTENADTRTPLRDYFVHTNDTVIYKVVKNYFSAVKAVFWDAQKENGFIIKTVGIQALFDVLRKLVSDAIESKDISIKYFDRRLRAAAYIDFGDDFFQASGTGRTRIRNSIEFAIGLKSLEELPLTTAAEGYSRILARTKNPHG